MKITVNANGDVTLDDIREGENFRALNMVRDLQTEARKINRVEAIVNAHVEYEPEPKPFEYEPVPEPVRPTPASMPRRIPVTPPGPVDSGELTPLQYRTWNWMVENDCIDGIHVSALGKAFGVTTPCANTRLVSLLKAGYVRRIHRGYYRATTGE